MPRDAGVRILFATDGSPGGGIACVTLAALPLRPTDEAIVVSFPSYLLAARPGGGGIIASLMDRELKRAQEVVSETVAALAATQRARVRGFVPSGPGAVDAIVQAALHCQVDLIVVGSRGRGPISSVLLGSTTRTLAMLTPVPILIARQRASALSRVLIAYDGSPAARAALAFLRRLPLPQDTRLTLATVLPVHDWLDATVDGDGEGRQLRQEVERQDATYAAGLLDEATVAMRDRRPNEVLIKPGPVPEAILGRATEMAADLIVLGSRGLSGPRRPFWGSTAERVATTARCAVLIVPVPVLSPESIAPDDTGRKRKTVTLTGDLVPSQSVR